jgi:hypothetical protein
VQRISERLAKLLTRQGLLTQDDDSSYLTLDALDDNALHHLQSHSVTSQQGKKVFTLQTIQLKPTKTIASAKWARSTALVCTLLLPPKRMSAKSWNVSAVTLRGQQ